MTQEDVKKVKTEAVAVISPVLSAAAQITIVDNATYSLADMFLKKIKTARRSIEDKLSPIIEPIRKGLDELYALKRELDAPLTSAENEIKSKMKSWQLAEARRVAEEEAARRREDERLRAEAAAKERAAERLRIEAENKQRQADAARSADARQAAERAAEQLRERQEAQAMESRQLELEAEAARAVPIAQVAKAASSSARKVKRWRITDMEKFILSVAMGDIPQDAVLVNEVAVNRYFKSVEVVAGWPGVEVYDDIVIAGR